MSTPNFFPAAPNFIPATMPSPKPTPLAAQATPASEQYGKEIKAGEQLGMGREESIRTPEMEQQTAGENQYWDNLWKTSPKEVWKAPGVATPLLYSSQFL